MNSKTIANDIEVVRNYFAALARGDLQTCGALLADDVTWHQPGRSGLSGQYRGKGELFPLLGRFMELSGGSFQIDEVRAVMANGGLVAASIHFQAQRGAQSMAMDGVDLMRVEGGLIREVWLFSADQAAEDRFWNAALAQP